jgi:hypothetical protein
VSPPHDPRPPADTGLPQARSAPVPLIPRARRPPEGERLLPDSPQPSVPRSRVSGLVWTALALGIVGVVGSPIALYDALTEATGLDRRSDGVRPAAQDVEIVGCGMHGTGYGLVATEATIRITNSTHEPQTYAVTVGVDDGIGRQVGEVSAFSTDLEPGEDVTLTESGVARDGTVPGAAACRLGSVDRFGF